MWDGRTMPPHSLSFGSMVDDGQIKTARSIVPVAEAANDEPTADLLTQRMQVHEKTAWMLRSMIA